MNERSRTNPWLRRLGILAASIVAAIAIGSFLLSRADGPIGILAGGPIRSGEPAALADLDWTALDALHDLELEIVGEGKTRTLWFSVHEGIPYVACDLDCVGGRLTRWPQQIERDDRVVLRIDGKRIEGRLIHVPHGTPEYDVVRAGRLQKFSGAGGPGAAAEAAAHNTVVEVGETLTGRAKRSEPGDRLFRVAPR